jgi:hypothetical protein
MTQRPHGSVSEYVPELFVGPAPGLFPLKLSPDLSEYLGALGVGGLYVDSRSATRSTRMRLAVWSFESAFRGLFLSGRLMWTRPGAIYEARRTQMQELAWQQLRAAANAYLAELARQEEISGYRPAWTRSPAARLVGSAAWLLPPDQRRVFVEEVCGNLAATRSPLEWIAYLSSQLVHMPRTVWIYRTERRRGPIR